MFFSSAGRVCCRPLPGATSLSAVCAGHPFMETRVLWDQMPAPVQLASSQREDVCRLHFQTLIVLRPRDLGPAGPSESHCVSCPASPPVVWSWGPALRHTEPQGQERISREAQEWPWGRPSGLGPEAARVLPRSPRRKTQGKVRVCMFGRAGAGSASLRQGEGGCQAMPGGLGAEKRWPWAQPSSTRALALPEP